MTAYSKTYGTGGDTDNFAGARALNKLETNLGRVYSIKDPQSMNRASYLPAENFAVSFATPQLITWTFSLTGNFNATGAGDAGVAVDLDTGSGFTTTPWVCNISEPLIGSYNNTVVFQWFLIPGHKVRWRKTQGSGTGNTSLLVGRRSSIAGLYTPATWTHREVVSSLTKPNKIIDVANAAWESSTVGSYTTVSTTASTATSPTDFHELYSYSLSSSGTQNVKTISMDGTTIAQMAGPGLPVMIPVEDTDSTQWAASLGGTASAYGYRGDLVAATSNFTAAESGTSVGNKFRDADDAAALGINATEAHTYTSHTAVTTVITPSTTHHTLGLYIMNLDPTAIAAAQATVEVNGTIRAVADSPAAALNLNRTQACMMTIIPPNHTWGATPNAQASVFARRSWKLPT